MTNSKTVTAIIPTFRRLDMLIQCLQGVYAMNRQPDQVLVVYRPDNDPETAGWLTEVARSAYSSLQLVPVFEPGVVAALNVGFAMAASDIIAIFDDDAVPRQDWISRIVPHFDNAAVGAVGGRDVVFGHTPIKETSKAGYIDFWGNVIGNHHIVVGKPREVEVVKGCNWALRRAAIGTLRLEERLLGKGAQVANELWFCLNLRHAGWKIVLDPGAIVDHYPAPQFDHARGIWSRQKCYEHVCNVTATQLAYYPWHLKLRYLLFQLVIGHPFCPGMYFSLRGILKRPKSFVETFLGGWTGFFKGWRMAQEFRCKPPGLPNKPTNQKK